MTSHRVILQLCIALGTACTDEAPSGVNLDGGVVMDSGLGEDASGTDPDAWASDSAWVMDANDAAPDGGDAAPGWLPSSCEGVMSPLLHAGCLQGLSEACAMHEAERDCSSQEILDINTFRFRCAWARVVTFADASACEGVQSTGRCVAAFLDRVAFECSHPCPEPGTPGNADVRSSFVYTDADELIEAFCGVSGPAMTAVGEGEVGRCDVGPSHPLCACAAAACGAQ